MPLFKDERELVSKSISPRLKEKDYNVRLGVRLKRLHSKLDKEGVLSTDELELEHPLSPDIDILYWHKDYSGEPILNAVEVKYFRFGENGLIRPPFYDGIGEALILCTYGVDYVHLWHFFDHEISNDTYSKYKTVITDTMNNIRSINYKCELLEKPIIVSNDKKEFYEGIILVLDMLKDFSYEGNLKSNSLRYNENSKIIRTLIKRAYRIVNR